MVGTRQRSTLWKCCNGHLGLNLLGHYLLHVHGLLGPLAPGNDPGGYVWRAWGYVWFGGASSSPKSVPPKGLQPRALEPYAIATPQPPHQRERNSFSSARPRGDLRRSPTTQEVEVIRERILHEARENFEKEIKKVIGPPRLAQGRRRQRGHGRGALGAAFFRNLNGSRGLMEAFCDR